MMQRTFSRYLLAITLGHISIGVVLFYPVFAEMINRGWINVAGPDYLMGAAAFWFMIFSWPLVMLIVQCWNNTNQISNAVLWTGLIGGIIGVSVVPVSGFWLTIVLFIVGLILNRKPSSNSLVAAG
ncbi:hypothetical protein DBZ36_10005 [Alginatibacterium sediminis]|uniref:Uncharacterized protein n=1 Tax=Alginatibacterium sediminis TaxID=2164068 RepID=A0A420EDJ8_9ALTE|nr:DUF6463 family protein [Alginatibacterium sediminis]RKF18724.1 hypothetical protein DBZ36_10005 [Alginatibacterium sediminis]